MDRLDIFLFENGLSKSRSNSKDLIKNGLVYVNGKICHKPSFAVSVEDDIKVSESANLFVGRGGLKLSKAIDEFSINLKDVVCLDIGASTGGFTDCMLKNGAKKVYAVDVGENQLDKSLCDDKRVVNLEKTNIKDIPSGYFSENIDFISIDVSFISLKQVLPKVSELLSDNGEIVALIKPQFEAGKKNLNK
ncbi:MAG: TlyA family RNA methyltransferase, partial [Oscillospiraceae bacterium]|nr:TlyA family RNA methyltransferase [Oscillospiraceae bacterium]